MKLINYEINRSGDKITISGSWTDRMRRPAAVTVRTHTGEMAAEASDVILSGDNKEVFEILTALSELGWRMGWRPDGLAGTLVKQVQNYRIPKEK